MEEAAHTSELRRERVATQPTAAHTLTQQSTSKLQLLF